MNNRPVACCLRCWSFVFYPFSEGKRKTVRARGGGGGGEKGGKGGHPKGGGGGGGGGVRKRELRDGIQMELQESRNSSYRDKFQ